MTSSNHNEDTSAEQFGAKLLASMGRGRPAVDGPPVDADLLRAFTDDQIDRGLRNGRDTRLNPQQTEIIRENIFRFDAWSKAYGRLLAKRTIRLARS